MIDFILPFFAGILFFGAMLLMGRSINRSLSRRKARKVASFASRDGMLYVHELIEPGKAVIRSADAVSRIAEGIRRKRWQANGPEFRGEHPAEKINA